MNKYLTVKQLRNLLTKFDEDSYVYVASPGISSTWYGLESKDVFEPKSDHLKGVYIGASDK